MATSVAKVANDEVSAANNNAIRKDIIQMGGDYATSTGSANAYALAIDSVITGAITTGTVFKFKANFTNTGASTLNVNSIGDTTIKKQSVGGLVDVDASDLISGNIYTVVYDGTYLQLTADNTTGINIAISMTFGEAVDGTSTPQAVYVKASDGKVYKTDANAGAGSTWNFIGFVKENVANNGTGKIIITGKITGFSALTINQNYYLSDTAGAISATPSTTNAYKVARAVSATEILIETGPKICIGHENLSVPAISGTTNTTITTPFKPKRISLKGILSVCDSAGVNCRTVAFSGEWNETTLLGGIRTNGTGSLSISTVDSSAELSSDPTEAPSAGTNRSSLTLTISSITDTSAVIHLANVITAGSGSNTGHYGRITYVIEG